MSEHDFCRNLYGHTMADVRKATTAEQRKKSWGYKFSGSVEFHGPDDYYWHGGGCCLWSAKEQGWYAWMESKGMYNEDGEFIGRKE
jgi:hypothetical protein